MVGQIEWGTSPQATKHLRIYQAVGNQGENLHALPVSFNASSQAFEEPRKHVSSQGEEVQTRILYCLQEMLEKIDRGFQNIPYQLAGQLSRQGSRMEEMGVSKSIPQQYQELGGSFQQILKDFQ